MKLIHMLEQDLLDTINNNNLYCSQYSIVHSKNQIKVGLSIYPYIKNKVQVHKDIYIGLAEITIDLHTKSIKKQLLSTLDKAMNVVLVLSKKLNGYENPLVLEYRVYVSKDLDKQTKVIILTNHPLMISNYEFYFDKKSAYNNINTYLNNPLENKYLPE